MTTKRELQEAVRRFDMTIPSDEEVREAIEKVENIPFEILYMSAGQDSNSVVKMKDGVKILLDLAQAVLDGKLVPALTKQEILQAIIMWASEEYASTDKARLIIHEKNFRKLAKALSNAMKEK
jgi:hypothetical protein